MVKAQREKPLVLCTSRSECCQQASVQAGANHPPSLPRPASLGCAILTRCRPDRVGALHMVESVAQSSSGSSRRHPRRRCRRPPAATSGHQLHRQCLPNLRIRVDADSTRPAAALIDAVLQLTLAAGHAGRAASACRLLKASIVSTQILLPEEASKRRINHELIMID